MADYFMKQYEKDVEEAFLCGDENVDIQNDSAEHAVVLIKNLIRNAKDEIIILCHRMAQEIYGDKGVLKALEDAYRRNPKLKVHAYVRAEIPDLTPFIATLIDHDADIRTNYTSCGDCKDIVVVDRKSGRMETDNKKRKAVGHLNNPSFWAEELQKFSFA